MNLISFLHLDWVAGALSFAGMYTVGKKLWWGWLINAFNCLLLIYINGYLRLWGFVPLNVVLLGLFVKNAWTWRRQ
jgi:hypothetical protein